MSRVANFKVRGPLLSDGFSEWLGLSEVFSEGHSDCLSEGLSERLLLSQNMLYDLNGLDQSSCYHTWWFILM